MMMRRLSKIVFILFVPLLVSAAPSGWTQWHGSAFNGVSDEKGLPDQWGAGTNIKWTADMPGISAATPIICDGRVYVSAYEKETSNLWALCYSSADGKDLWRQSVAAGMNPKNPNSIAASSSVAEPGRVIFTFSTGDMAAFDSDGKRLWKCNLVQTYGELGCKFGYSSSPVLRDGKLFVQMLRDTSNPSLLVCLDAASGKELWKVERVTSAKEENKDSYSTPCIFSDAARTLLIVAGGDYITAHDLVDGREIWRSECYAVADGKNINRLIASPAICGDSVVAPVNRGMLLVAAKIGSPGWAWTLPKAASDVSSPLCYKGNVYVIDGAKRAIFCLDSKTGTLLNTIKLPGKKAYYASPTVADGKIYAMTLAGDVVVLKADQSMELIRHIEMGDDSLGSSIAIANGCLFLRANKKLYCIGK